MAGEEDEESWDVLAEQRLGREGLHVKLDRGFEEGTYCVYVHFTELASRVGFAPARRRAEEFCGLLKTQLDRFAGHSIGETEYASGIGVPRKRREAAVMYMTFPVVMAASRFRDEAMKKEFHSAVLRAVQQWDQEQARFDTQRQESRRDAFRVRLGALLDRNDYQHLDKATKDRLLEEVPPLAFPPRGLEL
jgi:hypothetical protein